MFDFITIKEVKDNISIWCREMRKAENLSQQELARELDISRYTIVKLENGENTTIETILKVLQHFDEMRSLNQFVLDKVENLKNNQTMY